MFDRVILGLWWLLSLILSAIMLLYVFLHGEVHQADLGWVLYSIHAAAKSMWLQDYVSLWRPGYLLNVPLVQIGFTYTALKFVHFTCLLLSAAWLLWRIDRQVFRKVTAPICLILFFSFYTCSFRFIFDYYGGIPVFLMLGLAAYLSAHGRFRILFLVLSGFFFSQLVFANLAVLPGTFLGVLLLSLRYFSFSLDPAVKPRDDDGTQHEERNAVSLIAAFLIFFAITMTLYLGPGHAWAIYQAHVSHQQVFNSLVLKFILGLGFVALTIFCSWPLFFRSALQRWNCWLPVVWLWIVLAILLFSFLSLLPVYLYGHENFKLTAIGLCLGFSALVLGLALLKPIVNPSLWKKCTLLIIVVALVGLDNRVISDGTYISWLYLPIIFMVFVVLLERALKSRWRFLFYLLFALVVGVKPLLRIGFIGYSKPISVNSYPSQLGFLVDKNTANFERTASAAYYHSGCEDKPFLTYFDTPFVYLLFSRNAPFAQSWLSAYPMIPASRQTSNASIEKWLQQPHWCVLYYYSKISSQGNIRYVSATALLKKLSSRKIAVGHIGFGPEAYLYVR